MINTQSALSRPVVTLIADESFRPVWTTRGPKRKGWEALTANERAMAICLVLGQGVSEAVGHLKLPTMETTRCLQGALDTLGFLTPAAMREFHAAAAFRAGQKGKRPILSGG